MCEASNTLGTDDKCMQNCRPELWMEDNPLGDLALRKKAVYVLTIWITVPWS
jgi:hypothetical protein